MLSRIKHLLGDPQVRAGLDLVSGAGLNAVTGLAFWFVAARTFDESTVGVNAALISTMMLVAALSTLGLSNALIRFIPRYGRSARGLVIRSYGLAASVTLLVAPIAALIFGRNSDELSGLDAPLGVAGFTLACLLWVVFVLQDSVLVGIGKTKVIPIENGAHSVLKLLLLIGFATAGPQWGIFVAFVLPVVALLLVVNRIAFRRLSEPDFMESLAKPEEGLARFAQGEYAAIVVEIMLSGSIPLIVLALQGEEAAAFYAMAWAVAYTLMLVNSSIGSALLAEAARTPSRLPLQAAKAARQMATFVIPGAIALIVVAPYVLRVLGSTYADEATSLLRLFALTAIANIAIAVSVGWLRATRSVRKLVIVYGIRSLIILGLGVPLLAAYGIVGLGFGWLIGETTVAIGLIATLLRPLAFQLVPRRVIAGLSATRARAHHTAARTRLQDFVVSGNFDRNATASVTTATFDRAVFDLGGDEIVKAAWSELSRASLDRESRALRLLHSDERLSEFKRLVPNWLREGAHGDTAWFAQRRVNGTNGGGQDHEVFLPLAVAAISVLHHRTAKTALQSREDVIRRVVDIPIDAVRAARGSSSAELQRLSEWLHADLDQLAVLHTATIHGDFAPTNVLLTEGGGDVSAILDWEMSREFHLPEVDLGHMVNALAAAHLNVEYGAGFVRFLQSPDLAPTATMLLEIQSAAANKLSNITILTLGWLDHIAMNLDKSNAYGSNSFWLATNVDVVLAALSDIECSETASPLLTSR